jgi:hypothetical protein
MRSVKGVWSNTMTLQHKAIPMSLPDKIPPAIVPLLPKALNLIEQCFPGTQRIRGTMASDPEVGDEWLELQLTLGGEVTELADAWDEFTRQWVAVVPSPDHHLIRPSFDIL